MMIEELYDRIKKLNNDSKQYLEKMHELEKKYGYLMRISPIPEELNVSKRLFLADSDEFFIYMPIKFVNAYADGMCKLECIIFDTLLHKFKFGSLTIEMLEGCHEISFEDVRNRFLESKTKLNEEFDREYEHFINYKSADEAKQE